MRTVRVAVEWPAGPPEVGGSITPKPWGGTIKFEIEFAGVERRVYEFEVPVGVSEMDVRTALLDAARDAVMRTIVVEPVSEGDDASP